VPDPLRVLLVVHQFFPYSFFGTERYTLELALGLQELGHDVTVLTTLPRDGVEGIERTLERYTYEGVRVLALAGFLRAPLTFEETFRRGDLDDVIRETLWEIRPEVVHVCHLLNLTPDFLRLAGETHVPLFLTLTDFWGICSRGQLVTARNEQCEGPDRLAYNCVADMADAMDAPSASRLVNLGLRGLSGTPLHGLFANVLRALPGPLRRRFISDLDAVARRAGRFRVGYADADALIAPSEYLLDAYVRAGYARERFHKIPYGITLPDDAECKHLKARFSSDRPRDLPVRFGYMGQIAPHKGVRELLCAFRDAPLGDATLAIHGDMERQPAYAHELEDLLKGHPSICYHGPYPSETVYRVLSRIDVLVIPSLWHENAPLVLLNALASRTPVVIPRARGMVEFVRDGEDGLVYEMHDGNGLRDRLAELAAAPDRLRRMSERMDGYAFTRRDCAHATLELYRKALAPDRPVRFVAPSDRLQPELRRLTGPDATIPTCWDGDLLGLLARVRAQSFEVRVPRGDPPRRTEAPRKGKRSPRYQPVRLGLRIRYHSKPYFSLWSHRGQDLELSRHPAFADASCIEIVARYNRGNASLLRYALEDDADDADALSLRFSWPKRTWSRLVIPLRTRQGRRLRFLSWTPVVAEGRSPLKLDVLRIEFRRGDVPE
jgi:glycosyltransferase involved in cell wall biosynthesis